jgi:hypothetical protein
MGALSLFHSEKLICYIQVCSWDEVIFFLSCQKLCVNWWRHWNTSKCCSLFVLRRFYELNQCWRMLSSDILRRVVCYRRNVVPLSSASRRKWNNLFAWSTIALKTKAICSSDTSVNLYQTTRRSAPEDNTHHKVTVMKALNSTGVYAKEAVSDLVTKVNSINCYEPSVLVLACW